MKEKPVQKETQLYQMFNKTYYKSEIATTKANLSESPVSNRLIVSKENVSVCKFVSECINISIPKKY